MYARDNSERRIVLTYRWVIFLILAMGYAIVYFHRVSPAVVAPELTRSFHIKGVALGVLASAYFYPYAIMQLPSGLLSDSFGPRKTVTVFTLVASGGAILFGISPTFLIAILGRIMVGIGVSVVFIPTLKILANWFKAKEFAIVTGILMAIGGLGWLSAATPLSDLFCGISTGSRSSLDLDTLYEGNSLLTVFKPKLQGQEQVPDVFPTTLY